MGYGDLSAADYNRDGVVDLTDVALSLEGLSEVPDDGVSKTKGRALNGAVPSVRK